LPNGSAQELCYTYAKMVKEESYVKMVEEEKG
jgi:hypothetical protein